MGELIAGVEDIEEDFERLAAGLEVLDEPRDCLEEPTGSLQGFGRDLGELRLWFEVEASS